MNGLVRIEQMSDLLMYFLSVFSARERDKFWKHFCISKAEEKPR